MTVLILDTIAEKLLYSFGFKSRKSSSSQLNEEQPAEKIKINFHDFFKFGSILIVFIYIIPSLIFSQLTEDKWSFIDSLYFCYISISTIGFG